jgi:hypothetical protein
VLWDSVGWITAACWAGWGSLLAVAAAATTLRFISTWRMLLVAGLCSKPGRKQNSCLRSVWQQGVADQAVQADYCLHPPLAACSRCELHADHSYWRCVCTLVFQQGCSCLAKH